MDHSQRQEQSSISRVFLDPKKETTKTDKREHIFLKSRTKSTALPFYLYLSYFRGIFAERWNLSRWNSSLSRNLVGRISDSRDLYRATYFRFFEFRIVNAPRFRSRDFIFYSFISFERLPVFKTKLLRTSEASSQSVFGDCLGTLRCYYTCYVAA